MQSDLRMCRNSEPHPPSCFCTHGLFPMFNIAMAASCGPQGSHFCTSQLLEGGVGIYNVCIPKFMFILYSGSQ